MSTFANLAFLLKVCAALEGLGELQTSEKNSTAVRLMIENLKMLGLLAPRMRASIEQLAGRIDDLESQVEFWKAKAGGQ